MSRTRLVLLCTLLAAAAPVLLVAVAGTRPMTMPALLHFGLVGAVAVLTSGASVALSMAGARARDGRTVLMGMAFSTMTALFAVHALATPGFLVGANGVISLAGGLSIPAGALVLGLTALPALPALRRPGRVKPLLFAQVGLFFGVLALGLFGLADPAAVPNVPTPKSGPAIFLLVAGSACLVMLIFRAVRTALLTRRAADLAIAIGCAWLGAALYANLVIGAMTVAFYFGHFLEIAAVAMVSIPAALDIRRAGASRPLVGDLTAQELVASEEAYLGPRVRALMGRPADRDAWTEEHPRRVALLAASVADELKLPAAARRQLAVGGLLHDIGKLSVP